LPDSQSAANAVDCRKEANMNSKLTILYERLSVDDGSDSESNSIQNQRRMLEEYAERNSFVPFIHLSDDGYSGTGWNRPGWQKVIEEIEVGRVQNLIVKNLDRMGRDYLRVGLYMEMFREKGVRLIAVNDGIDTDKGEDDFTPFRAIMAEWYAKDVSKKIKAVITSKGKSGKPLVNIPPYGYVKSPEDKNIWLVDPEAAAVVKRIFDLTVEGNGPYQIAGILHDERIVRPSSYLAEKGLGRYKNTADEEHRYSWNYSTVVQILRKPEYAGHTANFKGEKANFKSKKYTLKPKEEWVVFENTHTPIVKQETWDLVQKLRETKRRADNLGAANPLTGLLWCAECGAKLFNHRRSTSTVQRRGDRTYYSKPQNHYICSTYKLTNIKFNAKCTPHIISTEAVKKIILDILQATSGYVRGHEQEFIEKVREMSAIRECETAKKHKKQIAKNERRIAELDKIYRSLYEDKALGKLSEARFTEMSGGYEREQADLKQQTAALQKELDAFNTDNIRVDKFTALVRKYTHFEELTPAIINEFVDKVVIHEGEWSDGRNPETGRGLGTRTQQVDVYLKYIGKFDVPDLRTVEEIEDERIRQERIDKERKYKREYGRKRTAAQKIAAQENTSCEIHSEKIPKRKTA